MLSFLQSPKSGKSSSIVTDEKTGYLGGGTWVGQG